MTCGEDGSVYWIHRDDTTTLSSQLAFRSTLPLRAITTRERLVAVSGDEMCICVLEKERDDICWKSETLMAVIVALAFKDDFLVISFAAPLDDNPSVV